MQGIIEALQSIALAIKPNSVVVQQVGVDYSGVATGTGVGQIIPNDDTIPQNTEGTEFMSLQITPKNANNYLRIEVEIMLANGNATQFFTTALFQDSIANALKANGEWEATANSPKTMTLKHRMLAGTTNAITFKVRAGTHQNTTTTFNGSAGARWYGAIPKSSIVITEYAP